MSIAEGLTSTEDTAELGQEGPQALDDQSSPGDRDEDLSDIREQDGLSYARSPGTYLHHKHPDMMQGERLIKASFWSWPERTG